MVNRKAAASAQPRLTDQAVGTAKRKLVPQPVSMGFVVCVPARLVFPPDNLFRIRETKATKIGPQCGSAWRRHPSVPLRQLRVPVFERFDGARSQLRQLVVGDPLQ